MGNPSRNLHAALVAAGPNPADDYAFDATHADFPRAVSAYVESRALADLMRIPLRAGALPTLYVLAPLSATGYASVMGMPPSLRAPSALLWAAVAELHDATPLPDGTGYTGRRVDVPAQDPKASARLRTASQAWLDDFFDAHGAHAVAELGSIVIARAEVGASARVSFVLPHPLTPPA